MYGLGGWQAAVANRWLRLQPFPVVEIVRDAVHWECALRLKLDEQGDWQPAGQFLPVAEHAPPTRDAPPASASARAWESFPGAPDSGGVSGA